MTKQKPGSTSNSRVRNEGSAAGHSLRAARALEVSRVHACSLAHSDARDWGKCRRLRSRECSSTASTGCERPTEPLSISPKPLDARQITHHVVSCLSRLSAAQHHLERDRRVLWILSGEIELG